MKSFIIFFALFSVTPFSAPALEESNFKPSSEIVVHLLDYLAKDYSGAVQDGKIISEGEYAEQVEFAAIVFKNANSLESLKDSDFLKNVSILNQTIKSKGSAAEVAKLARKLQQDAIRLAEIEVVPTMLPDLEVGKKLYQTSCVSCHGIGGHGDGLAGAGLDPKPANFHDQELIWNSAPFKFYNTIRLGVPGTGMAAFPTLTDHEVWSIAYYLKSIPYQNSIPNTTVHAVTAQDLATLTDAEIAERLGGKSDSNIALIASLRAHGISNGRIDPLVIAESLLNQSLNEVKSGNYTLAQTHAVNAYLQGIEPIEPKMRANLPGFVEQIETLMGSYRSSLSAGAPVVVLETKKNQIFEKLKEARAQLSQTKMSKGVAFGAAFSIFLREGFEAVLIIIVLLSILRAMNQAEAARWVHAGWILAVGVGIVAWFLSGALLSMSGLSRELMEGAISLLAVAVLIYVGFWLHRYSEMKKWRAFLEEKLRHGLNKKSFVGLALVSFLAVFREAFEVVLFLRAIWIDLDKSGQNFAASGILASLVVLSTLSYFAVKESKRLPLSKLFQACSWTMMLLAIVLAGKGAHSLQEAGLIPVTTFPLALRWDLVGLFPSYQTLLVQVGVVLVFFILFYNDKKTSH